MNISVFGLGYVGAITAACLADNGHYVIGVDTDEYKVNMINKGESPIIEKGIEDLIFKNYNEDRLKATTNAFKAIKDSEISLICVGTPSLRNGKLDLYFVKRVSKHIGKALNQKSEYHIVVVRSTVLPGTVEGVVLPNLEKHSKKISGKHFGVVFNPEFLREATAVNDFYNPPKIVIGQIKKEDGEKVRHLYDGIQSPIIYTNIKIAELVKYCDNAFHALKISFANEIGTICKRLGIDSHLVMDIFCQDTILNLSPTYLKPGYAFGGSCLPKDLRAISYFARHNDIDLPVLNSIINSNNSQVINALELIKNKRRKKIGFLGFAFKAGTDDLRESPVVTLIETLLGQGYEIQIYDKSVNLSFLRGTNKKYIEERIPHVASLIRENIKDIIKFAEVLVIGNKEKEFEKVLKKASKNQVIIDLVRISDNVQTFANYEGISW